MNRPSRITIAAVVAAIGSGLAVAIGLFAFLGAMYFPTAASGGLPRALLIVSPVLLLGAGAWGLATARGLLHLESWARTSMVIFSAIVAFMGAMGTFFVLSENMPTPPGISSKEFSVIRGAVTVVYFLFLVVGVWWLVQFSSTSVKAVFRGESEELLAPSAPAPSTGAAKALGSARPLRPLSITIIGCYLLAGTVSSALQILMGVPASIFGMTLAGPPASLLYLAFFAAQAYLGIGLLQLQPLSRILSIGFFLFSFMNTALLVGLPGREARLAAMVKSLPASMQPASGAQPAVTWWVPLVSAGIVTLIPIWFLITRKQAFVPRPNQR